ncbi:hypothetical protein L6452_06196 [Arctium lappa]|uniref:Uncharacterized protein n=1 Tax=Arctium lappa TaxID=4217 RepID=A0ACB9EI77_ARCLA|nr:hypothetical protein L6452_06196 [Arctium lappa]
MDVLKLTDEFQSLKQKLFEEKEKRKQMTKDLSFYKRENDLLESEKKEFFVEKSELEKAQRQKEKSFSEKFKELEKVLKAKEEEAPLYSPEIDECIRITFEDDIRRIYKENVISDFIKESCKKRIIKVSRPKNPMKTLEIVIFNKVKKDFLDSNSESDTEIDEQIFYTPEKVIHKTTQTIGSGILNIPAPIPKEKPIIPILSKKEKKMFWAKKKQVEKKRQSLRRKRKASLEKASKDGMPNVHQNPQKPNKKGPIMRWVPKKL